MRPQSLCAVSTLQRMFIFTLTYALEEPPLFWLQEKPEHPQFEPHVKIKMAQVLGSPLTLVYPCQGLNAMVRRRRFEVTTLWSWVQCSYHDYTRVPNSDLTIAWTWRLATQAPTYSNHSSIVLNGTYVASLGSRREAFLSQNISTCMCSFTLNPAFHQNSKVFSYNLALPLIYCWPTRLGKLLIRLKPPAMQSNGKVLWNTLQPIGAHSVLVTDLWKIPFGKRYCFVNLVQQNGIA